MSTNQQPVVRKSVPTIDTGMIKVARKPRGWRRVVRALGKLGAGLLGVVVLILIFLHTPWGKSFVKGRIESRLGAMVNGSASLGELDYGFMFGSLELGKLEIRDASDKPAIKIDRIALALDRGALLGGSLKMDELSITGVDVQVVKHADGTSNLTGLFKPSDRKPMKQIAIGKLAVSGAATITRPDGSVIAIEDLAIAGKLDARPATKLIDLTLDSVVAKLEIAKPEQATKRIDVALGDITLSRGPDAIDVDIAKLAAGALSVEKLGAHVELADGKPRGQQAITLGKAKIDNQELAKLLGREVLVDDIALELSITGPEDKLVIAGGARTRGTSLTIEGSADISSTPKYAIAISGKGKSTDISPKGKVAVATDLTIQIVGAGVTPADLDTTVDIAVGPTTVGQLALDGLTAKATMRAGTYKLEQLAARAVEFDLTASAELGADKAVTGKVSIAGSPAKAMKVLAAAGIAIPRKVPTIGHADLQVTAGGKLDGDLAVELAPTKILIAGGSIALAGNATLTNKKLRAASTKIELAQLDLAGLAALAGKPTTARGTLNGTIDLTKTADGQHADFGLAIALRNKPLTITAKGGADATSATAHAEVRRTGDRALLAALDARLPLDKQGFQPRGAWRIKADVANRQLSEIAALLGRTLPAGDVAIHADLAGSPAAPTGTIAITANAAALNNVPGKQKVALTATLVPSAGRLAVITKGNIALANQSALATIDGGLTMPFVWNGKQLDKAGLRAGLLVDTTIDIPERPLASLAQVRSKLAELGGTIGGRIVAKGSLKTPSLDARLAWRGYKNAAGTFGETTLAATGTPATPSITINHGGALLVYADIDRSNPDRIAIKARTRSAKTPLLPLLPASLAGEKSLGGAKLGTLHWNMDANLALAKTAAGMQVDLAAITGGLDIVGGSFALPSTRRVYKDIGLAVVAEPAGLRIKSLSVRESDLEKADRTLRVSGLVSLDKLKAKKVELSLAARDWLVFGGDKFGMIDAPRATASFDIGVAVDLTSPVLGVDATIRSLALRSPDRLERGHFVEKASVSGDVIIVDKTTKLGRLPVAVASTVAPRKKRPMDIRIHIPKAIRLEQTPMDVMAKGEVTVAIREDGTRINGKLTMESGKLDLFGHAHQLLEGSLTFDDAHPQGEMALTFERQLPAVAMRDLARRSGGARVTFKGTPSKPRTTLSGSANAAMLEVMAMYNAGRPTIAARPGLPATSLVQAPRGDQLFVLTFMASNLPHLLFLDKINAWSDPFAASYGQIANMEAEKYRGKARVRAVVRPARTSPGRSSAELQYDRVLINSDRAAAGVGVRAGDRLGGGVGAFVEWSSKD